MRYFALAALWLAVSTVALLVPVTFSVDGFGIIVSPDGVRTFRAQERGTVQHFEPEGDAFQPGEIISAVEFGDIRAENQFLLQTLLRDLAKAETDRMESVTRLVTTLERDRAKLDATTKRLSTRRELTNETRTTLEALRRFVVLSEAEADVLNAERETQLNSLEDMLRRSQAVAALPAQRAATMLDNIQQQRLSMISSESGKFSSDRMILDLATDLNELEFENAIDTAEVEILFARVRAYEKQVKDQDSLARSLEQEARTKYLARLKLPQISVAKATLSEMRQIQSDGAEVSKDEALRILAVREPAYGIHLLLLGRPHAGKMVLTLDDKQVAVDLVDLVKAEPISSAALENERRKIHSFNRRIAGETVFSIFVEVPKNEASGLAVEIHDPQNADGFPIAVRSEVISGDAEGAPSNPDAVIGFLENKHAVALQWDQPVFGAVQDVRSGRELRFEGRLLERDFAPVDTAELGVRLGNRSLASKIISRGILSQVSVGVAPQTTEELRALSGAVVHLKFPIARRSLISFLLERNAAL